MIFLALFILGVHIGSFLNVCIWRVPRGESVVEPPSHCPNCNTRLKALDLVPLFSQVFLRARCRYCGLKISWRYFGIEFLTGVLFVLAVLGSGYLSGGGWNPIWVGSVEDAVRLAQTLFVISCLLVVFWVDYKTFLIPLSAALLIGLTGVATDAFLVWRGASPLTDGTFFNVPWLPLEVPSSLLAMVVLASFLFLIRALASAIYGREAMGFGDVFLVAAIAANIGWNARLFTFFFLSAVVGATIGILLRVPHAVRVYRWAKRRENKARARQEAEREYSRTRWAWPMARHAFRKAMPFGPMLAIGAILTMIYGARLNGAYWGWIQNSTTPIALSAARASTRTR